MKPACLAALGCLVLALTCPGQQLAWTLIKSTRSSPLGIGQGMVYDSARKRTVLFGDAGPGLVANTWEWDGKSWTQIKTKTSPSARRFHAMVYDSHRQRTVLFGGGSNRGGLADTWEWDGKTWSKIKTTTSPSPRFKHTMAYDSARRRTVLFGGLSSIFRPGSADTWEWDGKNWKLLKPTTSPPPMGYAMVFDSARQRIVLFGGAASLHVAIVHTWEWDGRNWKQLKPTVSPPARNAHSMVYDSTRRRTVLFGGRIFLTGLRDTWEWDGSNWTPSKPLSSAWAQYDHAMAYDPVRRRTVLFGFGGTWELGKATLTTNTSTLSVSTGGTQVFSLDAGTEHAARYYWLLGSVTGVRPGISLGGVHFPLNPDFYTDFTIGFPNQSSRAKLNSNGRGIAFLRVPKGLPLPLNLTLHHAYLVYDAQGKWHMVSNPVPLTLVK